MYQTNIKEVAKQGLKRFLLLITFFAVPVINLHALEESEKALIARILHNVLVDKKLSTAISSLQEIIPEIKRNGIQYCGGLVVSDYTVGNTRHITTNHYYKGNGDVIAVVEKYKKSLEHLGSCNTLLAAHEGAILGVLTSIIGNKLEWNIKVLGISLFVSSMALTAAKNKHLGKVPYLTMPQLTPDDNYFDILTNVRTFLCILGASTVSHFGTDFLIKAISGKICAIKETVNTISQSSCGATPGTTI